MKKTIIVFFALCCFSAAHSQDLIQEFQRLTLINDSLQRQIIRPLQDSILILNTTHTENQNLLDRLRSELMEANSRIEDLDRNIVRIERDSLRALTDSLQIKSGGLSQKVSDLERENIIQGQQRYEEGRQNVYSQIAQTYNRPFDELIRFSTKQSVERDLLLIGNNETVKKRLQDLQKYFAAKQLLSERFNEQRINDALNQLADIEQSELVKNLSDKLRMYELTNDGLKRTVNRILDIDSRFIANDDNTQDLKLRDILAELSWYFRNFRFNFTDYPFLSGIVLEIMTLKQRDANADVSHLLDKL